jgi:hypothetical protein
LSWMRMVFGCTDRSSATAFTECRSAIMAATRASAGDGSNSACRISGGWRDGDGRVPVQKPGGPPAFPAIADDPKPTTSNCPAFNRSDDRPMFKIGPCGGTVIPHLGKAGRVPSYWCR